MLATRLETWEEARVIFVFHIVGTVMEIFKTGVGSWLYPEDSLLRIAGVPLFSGFMYASVGSYLARVWRIFDFSFTRFPPIWLQAALAAAIYANFFSHHFLPDIRIALFLASVPACDKQGEGERCDQLNGNDDCGAGLICTPGAALGQKSDICCPESGSSDPKSRCTPGGGQGGAGASAGAAGAGGDTGGNGGSTTSAAGGGTGGTGGVMSSGSGTGAMM